MDPLTLVMKMAESTVLQMVMTTFEMDERMEMLMATTMKRVETTAISTEAMKLLAETREILKVMVILYPLHFHKHHYRTNRA